MNDVERAATSTIASGSRTDVGAVREVNEDAVLAEFPFFVVADGMGGHAAGDIASAIALEQFRPLVGYAARQELVHAAIDAANEAIVEWTQQRPETMGMGTTLSGIALGEIGGSRHWFVFNVGDSRVYRYAGAVLSQVTSDHSEVAELIAAGRITADQARQHPRRNVITRSLGTQPGPVPDFWVLPAQPGEIYLVCSDGLTSEVGDDDIAAILHLRRSAQATANDLVDRALAAGARDNVSVVVVALADDDVAHDLDVATAPRPLYRDGVS